MDTALQAVQVEGLIDTICHHCPDRPSVRRSHWVWRTAVPGAPGDGPLWELGVSREGRRGSDLAAHFWAGAVVQGQALT